MTDLLRRNQRMLDVTARKNAVIAKLRSDKQYLNKTVRELRETIRRLLSV